MRVVNSYQTMHGSLFKTDIHHFVRSRAKDSLKRNNAKNRVRII